MTRQYTCWKNRAKTNAGQQSKCGRCRKNVEKCSGNTGRRLATSSSNGRKWYSEKSKIVYRRREPCQQESVEEGVKAIKKSNRPGFYAKQGLVVLKMRMSLDQRVYIYMQQFTDLPPWIVLKMKMSSDQPNIYIYIYYIFVEICRPAPPLGL